MNRENSTGVITIDLIVKAWKAMEDDAVRQGAYPFRDVFEVSKANKPLEEASHEP